MNEHEKAYLDLMRDSLNRMERNDERIWSAFGDLNKKMDTINSTVSDVKTDVETLKREEKKVQRRNDNWVLGVSGTFSAFIAGLFIAIWKIFFEK